VKSIAVAMPSRKLPPAMGRRLAMQALARRKASREEKVHIEMHEIREKMVKNGCS